MTQTGPLALSTARAVHVGDAIQLRRSAFTCFGNQAVDILHSRPIARDQIVGVQGWTGQLVAFSDTFWLLSLDVEYGNGRIGKPSVLIGVWHASSKRHPGFEHYYLQ